jgi:hypothetical protein
MIHWPRNRMLTVIYLSAFVFIEASLDAFALLYESIFSISIPRITRAFDCAHAARL